jgi:hypothetical protein
VVAVCYVAAIAHADALQNLSTLCDILLLPRRDERVLLMEQAKRIEVRMGLLVKVDTSSDTVDVWCGTIRAHPLHNVSSYTIKVAITEGQACTPHGTSKAH